MDRLRIAFYSDTYLPAVDGVVTSMLNFKKELERRGHRVYIFASGDSKAKRTYSSNTVFISRGVKFRPYPQYKIALFPYGNPVKLRSLGVDLVHAQTPFSMGFAGLLLGRLMGKPVVGSFHTMINDKEIVNAYYPGTKTIKGLTSRYLWRYASFFYKRCKVTIAPSESIKRMLNKQRIRKVLVVPNCVDTHRFNPKVKGRNLRDELALGDDDKIVLHVGRASREKRLDVLLKAARAIRSKREDVKFVIAGTGPALDYYKNLTNSMGLSDSVYFLGFVDVDKLPSVYAASDLFCMPSTFETQGIVALEAMATGKPVVGANKLALKELIQSGKNGEKFASGDYIECARKIEKVLNNSEAYRDGAVQTASLFSVERATDKLLDAYNSILQER